MWWKCELIHWQTAGMNKVHIKTALMTMEPTKKNVLMRILLEVLKASICWLKSRNPSYQFWKQSWCDYKKVWIWTESAMISKNTNKHNNGLFQEKLCEDRTDEEYPIFIIEFYIQLLRPTARDCSDENFNWH